MLVGEEQFLFEVLAWLENSVSERFVANNVNRLKTVSSRIFWFCYCIV